MNRAGGTDVRGYVLGWPEDRTLFAGLTVVQTIAIGLGALVGVSLMMSLPTGPGLMVGTGVIALAPALTMLPIGERSVLGWAPLVGGWIATRVRGRTVFTNVDAIDGVAPPQAVKGLHIIAHEVVGRRIGVIVRPDERTWTALLAVAGGGHQLADLAVKERRQQTWGTLLSGMARHGTPVARLQWCERVVPADHDALDRWTNAHRDLDIDTPAGGSYAELLAEAEPLGQRHEVLAAISIDGRRAAAAIRAAGGGDNGAAIVLCREVLTVAEQLRRGDLDVTGVLTPRLVAQAIQSSWAPDALKSLARLVTVTGAETGTEAASMWPTATEVCWDAYRTEGWWHATYWIAQWPRRPVAADFLAPLLLGTTAIRTVSVTLEPLDPSRALARAEARLVKGDTDDELRTKGGWRPTAKRRHERDRDERHADELAGGHADYRMTGLVSVAAPTREALNTACGEIEQHAHQAHLEVRRLFGRQDTPSRRACQSRPVSRRTEGARHAFAVNPTPGHDPQP